MARVSVRTINSFMVMLGLVLRLKPVIVIFITIRMELSVVLELE